MFFPCTLDLSVLTKTTTVKLADKQLAQSLQSGSKPAVSFQFLCIFQVFLLPLSLSFSLSLLFCFVHSFVFTFSFGNTTEMHESSVLGFLQEVFSWNNYNLISGEFLLFFLRMTKLV